MHTILLTMIALAGADARGFQHVGPAPQGSYYDEAVDTSWGGYDDGGDCGCGGGCGGGDGLMGGGWGGGLMRSRAGEVSCFRRMPQTCYAPRYGCYHGNERHMHRYPAFHGTFYRRPYNYRNVFDYPWHAELHEPTSLFSYNVAEGEAVGPSQREDLPPVPPSTARAGRGVRAYIGDQ